MTLDGSEAGIIPAYAGSTFSWVPINVAISGSSPHTRGAPPDHASPGPLFGIIPAYAGSTTHQTTARRHYEDHPRIRGEHDARGIQGPLDAGSSPHTRGARPARPAQVVSTRIIPAYAGSTAGPAGSGCFDEDHPRIRGEHGSWGRVSLAGLGSSPHTRGARGGGSGQDAGCDIIPAYAGSTPAGRPGRRPRRDHPRIRGEHTGFVPALHAARGSSPHTRGARGHGFAGLVGGRIIPAYAGSTSASRTSGNTTWDHPRIRGEHSKLQSDRNKLTGSSPHTRGARDGEGAQAAGQRIIPAYAGSTRR